MPQTAHYMTRSDIYLAAILCCTIGCSDPQPETPSIIKQAEDMKPETPASEHPDKKGTVTVPPGYKVVVAHASTEAALSKSESGYWIAQMGNAGGEQSVLAELKTLTATGRPANVIWIIPTQFLKTLNDPAQFVTAVDSLVKDSGGSFGFTAVVPGASAEHEPMMARLQAVGVGVHYAADDGACFVEVHKPEGIVVGMPGAAFQK